MWKNERRIFPIILKVLAGILCVAIAVALFYAIKRQQRIEEDENKMFLQSYYKQVEAETEKSQANLDLVYNTYAENLAVVEKNLPGLVFWGDTLTLGAVNGVSYPSVIKEKIDENICSRYNLRKEMSKIGDYSVSRLDWDSFKISVPVVNMGAEAENAVTVAGRAGAVPFMVYQDFEIPEDREPVRIYLRSSFDSLSVNPLVKSNDNGINEVIINGISGRLSLDNKGYYSFTRSLPGMSVNVSAGTEVITAASTLYRDYIPVILIGTYGGFDKAKQLVDVVKQLVERHKTESGRYLVLSPFTADADFYYTNFNEIEDQMQAEFGENFINVRKYFCSDALSDAGIAMTDEDEHNIAYGKVPASILNPLSKTELSATGYRLLGEFIYNRMEQLGWFDEIRTECGIEAYENN